MDWNECLGSRWGWEGEGLICEEGKSETCGMRFGDYGEGGAWI